MPQQAIKLREGSHNHKLEFLTKALPEVNFITLMDCIKGNESAHQILHEYLKENNERMLSKHHFQALESMRQMKMISVI